MQLYYSTRSPYSRKALIAAHELGLRDGIDLVPVVVGGTIRHPVLSGLNPLGKIPTLVLGDGSAIYDSAVICDYLDGLHGSPTLHPPAGPQRLQALRWAALGDGIMDLSLQRQGERSRPPERQSHPHLEAWDEKVMKSLDVLESEATALQAARFGVGHIAVGAALGYLDFRFADQPWKPARPTLAAWQAAFEARASARATTHELAAAAA